MRAFFIFSMVYLAVAIALVFLIRDDPAALIASAIVSSSLLIGAFSTYLKYIGLALVAGLYLSRSYGFKHRIKPAIYAMLGCILFPAAFSMVKTSIPYLLPFYADPMLADLDRVLHGGIDPWVLTHKIQPYISADWVMNFYFFVWTLPAIFLPVMIALTDTDRARSMRFVTLHVLCWVVLGNVVALALSSVGPIYYDRLLGVERFAGLLEMIAASGVADTQLGRVQNGLWTTYINDGQSMGSGISAFPSVHVGVATVTALYLAERSKYLIPIGFGFLAIIQFCSVYIGWHYAVDGYFSIIAIMAIWVAQRRWIARKRRHVAFASTAPA